MESLPGVNEVIRLLYIYFFIVHNANMARDQTENHFIILDLFKKFLSLTQFIASVEVSHMARCSSNTNELRNVDSIGCRARSITI